MKSIASMPAMSGPSFRPLRFLDRLKRSQSASTNKPQDRMRHIAKRVPFMAFPGVSSHLAAFARSFSRANIARLGFSRAASHANLPGSYGSITADQQQPMLTSPPAGPVAGFEREYSEGSLLGNMFTGGDDDLELMQPSWTLALGLAVFTSVLASFQVGYNSGVLNVPQDIIVSSLGLSTIQWSIAVSIFCIGGLIGSMIGGPVADQIGRKNFLITNNVAFIGGGLLQALAPSFFMLSAGRLLIGVGCGGATVVVPMYLGEIAPANLRGSLGTMNQFSQVVGILIANLLGRPLGGDEESWRYLLGLCLVPALLQTIMAAALLESPLWLVQQGGAKNRVHAEEVLGKLRGTDDVEFDIECMLAESAGGDDDDFDEEADGFGGGRWNRSSHGSSNDLFHDGSILSNDSPNGVGGSVVGSGSNTGTHTPSRDRRCSSIEKGSLTLKKQLADAKHAEHVAKSSLWYHEYRRPLAIGFGLQLAQQFSGINAVFFYSTMFFTNAGMDDPWLGSVLASGVNVVATGLSIYLIERTGRRPLLLLSTAGMMMACGGLTYALVQSMPHPHEADHTDALTKTAASAAATVAAAAVSSPPAWLGMMSIAMVLGFVTFFEIGLGPIPWLIGSEIYPRHVRTSAMSISSTINWLSNFAVGLTFPTLSHVLGPMSFVPFGIVLAIAFILEYLYVPETQGKTLEEIQEEFILMQQHEDEAEEQPLSASSTTTTATAASIASAMHKSDKKSPNTLSASASALGTSARRLSHRSDDESSPIMEEDVDDAVHDRDHDHDENGISSSEEEPVSEDDDESIQPIGESSSSANSSIAEDDSE